MAMKRVSLFQVKGKSMETETIIWSEFSNAGKATVQQMLATEERHKP